MILEVEGVGVITESDLLHSPIIGCTKTTAGIPTPCIKVSVNYHWSIENAA
ncbi:hypothetical protein [Helicobacter typhlonius]|uniref:hypothetical protein n=1 Tax=Helicobacter typhlonius TaxID=76936 RepID=UPI002FE082C3